jgi:hypothetical protein
MMFNYYYQKSYNQVPVITTGLTKENCASAFNRHNFDEKDKHIFPTPMQLTLKQNHVTPHTLPHISV